jgi:hypothetical protein
MYMYIKRSILSDTLLVSVLFIHCITLFFTIVLLPNKPALVKCLKLRKNPHKVISFYNTGKPP